MRLKSVLLLAVSTSVISSLAPTSAIAQTVEDEVISVGTLIKRKAQADRASPVATLGEADIDISGAKNIADITQTLTINTGAENNPDAFTQGGTTGTTNINLRGLGVQSTLVMLNGRRQVLSAATTNGGFQFVDTSSLVPLIAVEDIEILKDGASATYGSDAVAGVVNFSTHDNYDGIKLSADYQTVDGYDSDEILLQGMIGKEFDRGNIMGAISYTDRSPLTTAEKRLSRPQDDTSSLGNPGAYIPISGGLAGIPLIDPGCADQGGFPTILGPNVAGLDIGLCGFDFGDFFNLVAEEERLNGLLQASFDLTDNISWMADFTYADNSAVRGNSPSFPFLQSGFVPSSHPNYLPTLSALAPDGAIFFGRAFGNGGVVSPNEQNSETYRFSTELDGSLNDRMDWRLSFIRGENNHTVATDDTVTSRFRCALTGTCTAIGGPAGFFNPFSSSFDTAPNSPEIEDYVIGTAFRDLTSTLNVVEGVVSREMGGGAALALGVQYRKEEYVGEFDAISNADDFGFLIGEQDYSGEQDILAIFGEAIIPVSDEVEFQLAGRFEDYGGNVGSTFDPKAAVLVRPTDSLSLRGSVSTSFRSPTVYQQQGQGTALVQVSDPVNGGANAFIAARSLGSEDLKPETSTAFNVGASWEPVESLEIDLDYFDFSFEDVIIPENPQAIINEDPNGPQIIRAGGLPTGTIVRVNANYVNASSVDTSGIDFSAKYTADTDMGLIVPFISGTYVTKYDLDDPQAGKVDGAGQRNFSNFGTSVPELRFNAGVGWQKGIHTINVFARHISSFDDDQNQDDEGNNLEVDSQTTYDAQYKVNLGDLIENEFTEGMTLTLGARNITDEDPPQVFTNGGFDSKVHDPRGRLLYIGADVEF